MHTDIYPPASPRRRPPSNHSHPTNHSSSSLSSSVGPRAGLGALAAVVEHAITRWARRRDTSSTSSSTSSRSSKRSRRSHGRSFSQSEKDFAAHIALVKARKEAQQVPRQFTLYLPPLHDKHCSDGTQSLTITDSLPVILDRLELALKKSFKAQHEQEIFRRTQKETTGTSSATSSVPAGQTSLLASILSYSKIKKGKGKARSVSFPPIRTVGTVVDSSPKAWYVDIASPSWEDLRALGKLLHLHPLTLEDILQNESREKVEIFPRLGYYFISFRAMETSKSSHDQTHQQDNREVQPVGGANVYLAVFKHGICTFHFTDTSAHTRRVLNRINKLDEVFNLSSDWIAYEMLDSIVDSFFPYLEEIDKEVLAIEKLLFSRNSRSSRENSMTTPSLAIGARTDEEIAEKSTEIPSKEHDDDVGTPHEKFGFKINTLARLSSMKPPKFNLWRRLRRLASHLKITSEDSLVQNSKATLRHIGRTRRLVTSLSRLLATKFDVVTQIRKRLLINSQLEMGSQDSPDIAMYMDDMQDHIYTLQHSLAHYERMLRQLHPTYLSQLRTDGELTRGGKEKGLMCLSVITVATLCIQSYIGIFSMNVSLPHNTRDPTGTYHVFGFVLATSVMIPIACCSLVWYWWEQAKLRKTNL